MDFGRYWQPNPKSGSDRKWKPEVAASEKKQPCIYNHLNQPMYRRQKKFKLQPISCSKEGHRCHLSKRAWKLPTRARAKLKLWSITPAKSTATGAIGAKTIS